MRYIRLSLTMVAYALVIGCVTSGPTEHTGQMHTKAVYEVYGMDCPGCHGGLEKNLTKIPGVSGATANWKQKTVAVRVEEGASVEDAQIKKAVEDSNFTLGRRRE